MYPLENSSTGRKWTDYVHPTADQTMRAGYTGQAAPLPAGNHLSEPAQFVFLGRSVCP